MATSTLGSGTLVLAGTTSGTTTVTATAVAGTTTLTLPAATDTLVGKATTDTLTNKTLTGAAMNGTVGATTPSTGAFTTGTFNSTLAVTGTFTPGQTTGIVGTTTTNDAQAGSVGETVMSSITTPTNYPATGTFGDLTSISLTAGDWDIAAVTQQTTPGTMTGETRIGISTTSGNSTTDLTIGYNRLTFPNATVAADSGASIPMYRLQLGSTTTVYLKFFTEYTAGTPKALGTIIARRRR